MTNSIYNNAGMPSGQGATPEIPEDLRKDHAQILRMRAKGVTLPWFGNDKQIELIERIAALTLERDTLKAERDEPWKHSEHWRNPETGQVECDCCCGWALDAERTAKEVVALKAKVERLSAPVSDAEWLLLKIFADDGLSESHREHIGTLIAARASTPPAHPINDDEQRRKDAAWNDRPKARCVCGEMIAWYSGEWLHVAGRSKSCADGRLASPAHFLVGAPPAEPEWQKEQRAGGPMAKIGELRRALFVSFDCKWNGLVRDVTAEYETHGEEVDVCVVLQRLINVIRENAQLDHSFPAASRLAEMFALSDFNDDYVAWMRWAGDTGRRHLTLCDSDSLGAFRVYRHPSSPSPDSTTAPLP